MYLVYWVVVGIGGIARSIVAWKVQGGVASGVAVATLTSGEEETIMRSMVAEGTETDLTHSRLWLKARQACKQTGKNSVHAAEHMPQVQVTLLYSALRTYSHV